MANKNVFKSVSSGNRAVPVANTTNLAGGKAYSMSDKHALAQFACTGTFGNTYYADASAQLETIKKMVDKVEPAFISKLAIYSRQSAFMKDMPAYLLAVLAAKDIDLFKQTFPQVMDNGKMVRNFIQIVRSGVTGRKSLGTAPKRMIKEWLEARKDEQVFYDSVGNDPSLSDVIKMVHPRPGTKSREALYGYITNKEHNASLLPGIVKEFEAFKSAIANKTKAKVPNINFQMLTALPLGEDEWKEIATNAKWQMTRMNLNTFGRHGVFKDQKMVKMVADRLRDKSLIQKSKVFPYQLFAAYLNADPSSTPVEVVNALQDAMEIAIENIPKVDGKVYVCVDISGSMDSPVTGYRPGGVASRVSCRMVAGLIASAIKRKNRDAEVLTFDTKARFVPVNGHDSVMTNAKVIAAPGGGTDCSAPVRLLNEQKKNGDVVIIVSDNESWYDRSSLFYGSSTNGTGLMAEWSKFKQRNKNAKLVCIDLTPNTTVQAPDAKDRLNVGGFSDNVFTVISDFLTENGSPEYWVKRIENLSGSTSISSSTETMDDAKE